MASIVPTLDFSILGDLPKTYREARRESLRDQKLAELSRQTGPFDFASAVRGMIALGDTTAAGKFAEVGFKDALAKASASGQGARSGTAAPAQPARVAQSGSLPAAVAMPPIAGANAPQASGGAPPWGNSLPAGMTAQDVFAQAQAAIAAGKDRGAVEERLRTLGLVP